MVCRRSQHPLDFKEVVIQRVDKTFGLAVLGGNGDGDRGVLDDIAYSETIGGGGTEAECTEGGVAAVGGGEDGVIEAVPSCIRKDGGDIRRGFGRWGTADGGIN